MKGFIIGLALTIIVGQLPKLLRGREGRRQLLRTGVGLHRAISATRNGARSLVGVLSFAIVLVLRRFAPGRAGVAGRGRVRHRCRPPLRPRPARASRSSATSTAGSRRSGCPHELSLSDYFAASASAVGIMLVGVRRRSRRGQDVRGPEPLRDRRQPRAASASAPPTSASGFCQGMVVNGQPLQDRGQRRQPAPRSQLSGLVAAVVTVVTLLFLTGLFEDLPEATLGARRHRRARRAGRRRRAGRGSTASRPSRLGKHLRGRGAARLHRRDGRDVRRADLRHPARACSSASPSRCCCSCTAPRTRTSPSSAR